MNPLQTDFEKLQLDKALHESAEMERNRKRAIELQFLDDLKRSILIYGGHVAELGAHPVDEQVFLSLFLLISLFWQLIISSDPSQKIIRKKTVEMPNRLKLLRAAMREDDGGGNDDEIDFERAVRFESKKIS